MGITDRQIEYRRKRLYLSAVENAMWIVSAEGTNGAVTMAHNLAATPGIVAINYTGWAGDDTADWVAGTHTATNAVGDIGGDATTFARALCGIAGTEVSTFGFPGVQFLESDVIGWCLRVPIEFDPLWELGFRVHFTSASVTAADDFQFTVAFDVKDAPAATSELAAVAVAGTALAAASTALNTVIAAQTWVDATAHKNTWSPRGIRDPEWSSQGAIEDGATMVISLTATVADTAAILLGLEIDYMPRLTTGYSGAERDGPLVGAPPV